MAILQAKLEEERSSDEPASLVVTEAMQPDAVVADVNGDGLRDIYGRVPPTGWVLERHKATAGLHVNLGNGSFSALSARLLRTQR